MDPACVAFLGGGLPALKFGAGASSAFISSIIASICSSVSADSGGTFSTSKTFGMNAAAMRR
jgi:hypothetical protein